MRWNSDGVSTPSHLKRLQNASPFLPVSERNTGILPVPSSRHLCLHVTKLRNPHPPDPQSYASRYLIPDPVLKTTTRSPDRILPSERSDFRAAKHAAPSGQTKRPSFAPTSRATRIISSSSTAIAPPLDSRRIFRIRKSPIAFGTRKPEAIVCASGISAAFF